MLRQAADRHGLLVASEVAEAAHVAALEPHVDLLQVGARNMQNAPLLEALGRTRRPVLIKRGVAATIEELLLAADSILAGGNESVILCERGIRTFAEHTRHTMDIAGIVEVKKLSHLPIVADPSYGTGRRDKVLAMGRACIAAGADGLIVEIHPDPDNAQRGGAQSLPLGQFAELMKQLHLIAPALGRSL
jgi:3-deoxy-7-phosphoheptulonate synthase